MIRLDDWRTAQLKELEKWEANLDTIITPDKVTPVTIHDYPKCRHTSEQLRKLCQLKQRDLKDKLEKMSDDYMQEIEDVQVLLKINRAGIKQYKKKFTSEAARQRELRRRLANDDEYVRLEKERTDWEYMAHDWKCHDDKLRREYQILELDYVHNGGQVFNS